MPKGIHVSRQAGTNGRGVFEHVYSYYPGGGTFIHRTLSHEPFRPARDYVGGAAKC
jgi:hypothetical protein